MKIKTSFEVNKFFLYNTFDSFHLFFLFYVKIK